jgi:hypothetical protein
MKDNLDAVEFYDNDERGPMPLMVGLALIGFCAGFWLCVGWAAYRWIW